MSDTTVTQKLNPGVAVSLEPTRNLIMIYRPGLLDVRDFEMIKEKIEILAPDIAVFIVEGTRLSPIARKKAATRPTLVFSPLWVMKFRPARGKIYSGHPIGKVEQMRRLEAAGIAVPKWILLTPETRLRFEDWGDHVIVKPSAFGAASLARGVVIRRTQEVVYRNPWDYPDGDPGRRGPMIVQKYVDTGQKVQRSRLATLFGHPMYATTILFREERPLISEVDNLQQFDFFGITPATGRRREFDDDAELLALGPRIYSCFPEVPWQNIDVLREETTGKLYVLEINPGGNTWHFSSGSAERTRSELGGLRLEDQFGAFGIAADVLIEKTRNEAE